MDIRAKRIYDAPLPGDGRRVLVDRLWPRGMSKNRAHLDEWLKEVGPSDELREWFGHDPAKYGEFAGKYRAELDTDPEKQEAVARLLDLAREGPLTLLYGARDTDHNQAVVLRDYLLEKSGK